jgi:hypothetical protein
VTGCSDSCGACLDVCEGGAGLVSSAFEVGSFMAVCCSSRACVDTCGVG